ncbi:uncharacterized protein BX664DRAFT_338519 [Halteromyces radiatus]|uniref:uncharacterized protein n=1 Tax=Halteromyces radiatus TaxID=101107 RepID=UPI00221F29DD|nr:uncharacterized protein BX664DRAFT_338519 [Halteromyces radiatus]KAI8085102.1 hypothetical protein BX664DRAFT_338519 [Halteromyces radiatus]
MVSSIPLFYFVGLSLSLSLSPSVSSSVSHWNYAFCKILSYVIGLCLLCLLPLDMVFPYCCSLQCCYSTSCISLFLQQEVNKFSCAYTLRNVFLVVRLVLVMIYSSIMLHDV